MLVARAYLHDCMGVPGYPVPWAELTRPKGMTRQGRPVLERTDYRVVAGRQLRLLTLESTSVTAGIT